MNKEDKILSILETMQTDVSSLKTDVSSLKTDMSALKIKVDEIDVKVDDVRAETDRLHNSLAVIERDHGLKLNLLYELVPDKLKEVDEIKQTVEKLEFGKEVIRFLSYIESKQAN